MPLPDQTVLTMLGLGGAAATFAGFSGVVVVFGRRMPGEWTHADRFRLTNLLVLSLATCFLSFLPLVHAMFGPGERVLWPVASGAFALFGVVYHAIVVPQWWRVYHEPSRPLSPVVSVVAYTTTATAVLVQAANWGLLREPSGGPYAIGLLLLLLVAAVLFALLVLKPLADDEQRERAR